MNDCECEVIDTVQLMNFGDFHAGNFSRLVGEMVRPEAGHSTVCRTEDSDRASVSIIPIQCSWRLTTWQFKAGKIIPEQGGSLFYVSAVTEKP